MLGSVALLRVTGCSGKKASPMPMSWAEPPKAPMLKTVEERQRLPGHGLVELRRNS